MSTRATYEFRSKHNPRVTIYIHHDGYPEGAAGLYLVPAIKKGGGRLTVESFIRANERAEITESHAAHGDTEHRYTFDLDAGTVKHDVRVYPDGYTHEPKWKQGAPGAIVDFVNNYAGSFLPGFQAIAAGGRIVTRTMAEAEAKAAADEAKAYAEKFPGHSGNQYWADKKAVEAAALLASFDAVEAAA